MSDELAEKAKEWLASYRCKAGVGPSHEDDLLDAYIAGAVESIASESNKMRVFCCGKSWTTNALHSFVCPLCGFGKEGSPKLKLVQQSEAKR